jgi:hypothetical protein
MMTTMDGDAQEVKKTKVITMTMTMTPMTMTPMMMTPMTIHDDDGSRNKKQAIAMTMTPMEANNCGRQR